MSTMTKSKTQTSHFYNCASHRQKLELVAKFPVITVAQIQRLLGIQPNGKIANYDSIKHTMALLAKRGLVRSGSIPKHNRRGHTHPNVYWTGEPRGVTTLLHDNQVTECGIVLEEALRNTPYGYKWQTRSLKFVKDTHSYNPDALFAIIQGERAKVYDLERERSGSVKQFGDGESSIVKKCRATVYLRDQKLLVPDRRRIFLFDTDDRVDFRLKEIAAQYPYRLFYLSTFKTFLAEPLGRIFRTPKDFHQRVYYSLLD